MTRRSGGRKRLSTMVCLSAAVVLIGSACAKGRTTTSSGPTAYNVFAQKFTYHGFPASFKTGNLQINFSNKESFPIVHEMIVAQLPAGKSRQDVIDSAKVKGCTGGGPCESQYLHFGEIDDASTGATKSQVFDLPPGTYFLACWQQGTPDGKDNGPTHASIGMVWTFTVSP